MKPYFEEDGIQIFHGDCREVLPSLEPVDLVLTDPPYGIGVEYASYEDTPEALETLIREVFPLLQAAAPVVALTPGVTNVHAWPKPRWILAWVHMNPYSARGFWGFNEWQPILAYGTDPFLRRGLGARPDVIKTIINVDGLSTWARANHPCPKPEPAWRRILGRCAPPRYFFCR